MLQLKLKKKKKVKIMEVVRSEQEIADLYNQCVESENEGESKFFGMTYEQGIKNCLDWLEGGDHPLND